MLISLSASHKNSTFDVLEKLSVGAEGPGIDDLATGFVAEDEAIARRRLDRASLAGRYPRLH